MHMSAGVCFQGSCFVPWKCQQAWRALSVYFWAGVPRSLDPGRGTFAALNSVSMAFFISEISFRRGSEGGGVREWDVGLYPRIFALVGDGMR